MKEYLHRKYNWYQCHFPLMSYSNGDTIECRWCKKRYKVEGLPYIGDPNFKLIPLEEQSHE